MSHHELDEWGSAPVSDAGPTQRTRGAARPVWQCPSMPALSGELWASVVVAVRGNPAALAGLLGALAGQEQVPAGGLEVVVVDNHARPHPAVAAAVRAACGDGLVTVVVHEARAGLSRARNHGLRRARGRIVLVTDPDARPEPAWAARLVEALERTGAYCAGGRVVPRYTGAAPTDLDPELVKLFAPPAWPARVEPVAGPYWLAGCNLAVRRHPLPVFCEALGACGRRRSTCEDLEFVTRAQREGLAVVVVPDAVVHRAVHPADLTVVGLLRRGFAHGASVARLTALHPELVIFDDYRWGHVLERWRQDRVSALVAAARILGRALERVRQLVLGAASDIGPGALGVGGRLPRSRRRA